ncbi:acrosin-like [Phaenicophaeus curvirostris]|uniref:acrosin-like n=1 Tax=Phaenicophaeus curvirostris TaxID=33595 RepID=UPI0037F0F1D2
MRMLLVLILLSLCQSVQGTDCGLPLMDHGYSMSRVIGSRVAQAGAWPWVVSMQSPWAADKWHVCGGTIISPEWVLIAAHCFIEARSGAPANRDIPATLAGAQPAAPWQTGTPFSCGSQWRSSHLLGSMDWALQAGGSDQLGQRLRQSPSAGVYVSTQHFFNWILEQIELQPAGSPVPTPPPALTPAILHESMQTASATPCPFPCQKLVAFFKLMWELLQFSWAGKA